MTHTLPRVRRAVVAVLVAWLVLASGGACDDPPGGLCVNGCRQPWGDPEKGQFAERSGGAS